MEGGREGVLFVFDSHNYYGSFGEEISQKDIENLCFVNIYLLVLVEGIIKPPKFPTITK